MTTWNRHYPDRPKASRKVPLSAGKVWSEEDIRGYAKCHKLGLEYKGTHKLPLQTRMVARAYEDSISQMLFQNGVVDATRNLTHAAWNDEEFLELSESKQDSYLMVGQRALKQIFREIPMRRLNIIAPPMDLTVQVAHTAISLHFSAFLQSRKVAHVVEFSAYQTPHGVFNDPLLPLKVVTAPNLLKVDGKPPRTIYHLLYFTEKLEYNSREAYCHHRTIHSRHMDQTNLVEIKRLVEELEAGYKSPVLPCLYTCPHKAVCMPEFKYGKP